MAKSFSEKLKDLIERLEENINLNFEEISEGFGDIDDDSADFNLEMNDDVRDVLREMKWLAEDMEEPSAQSAVLMERNRILILAGNVLSSRISNVLVPAIDDSALEAAVSKWNKAKGE